jgi:hypothetical protein
MHRIGRKLKNQFWKQEKPEQIHSENKKVGNTGKVSGEK